MLRAWITAGLAGISIIPTLRIGLRMREMRFLGWSAWLCIGTSILVITAVVIGYVLATKSAAQGVPMQQSAPTDPMAIGILMIPVVLTIFALALNVWRGGPIFGLYVTCLQLSLCVVLIALIVIYLGVRNDPDAESRHKTTT
jgi:hypothetical protein